MSECENCLSTVGSLDLFCGNCGASVASTSSEVGQRMVQAGSCRSCGVLLSGDAFCGSCGEPAAPYTSGQSTLGGALPVDASGVTSGQAHDTTWSRSQPDDSYQSGGYLVHVEPTTMVDVVTRSAEEKAADRRMRFEQLGAWLLRVVPVLAVLGGLAAVGQLGLRWVVDGNGSAFTGRDLAGQLMYGRSRPTWGPVGGALMFLAAMLGAWSVATSLLRHRLVGVVRAAVGLVIALGMGALSLAGAFEFDDWALGARLLAIGGLALFVSGVIEVLMDGRVSAPQWSRSSRVGAIVLGVAAGGLSLFLLVVASAGLENGEPTPEAAVQRFVDALDQSDLFAATTIVSTAEVGEFETALRELETALRASPTLRGASTSIDLGVSLGSLSTRELATGVAEVSGDLRLAASATGLDGGVLEPASSIDTIALEDFGVVTVFEDGGWWVSPMLTAGSLVAESLDLPQGAYSRVAVAAEGLDIATSEQTAIDRIAEGLTNSDPERLAEGLARGARRLVAVYGDAIQELMDSLQESVGLAIDDAVLSATATGGFAVSELRGEVGTPGSGTADLVLDDGCVDDSGDSLCLLDGLPLTQALTGAQLPIVFGGEGDEVTVQVFSTAIRWATVVAPLVDPTLVADILGTEELAASDPLSFGAAQTLALGTGVRFRNLTLATTPNEPFTLSLSGESLVYAELYEADPGGERYVANVASNSADITGYPVVIVPESTSMTVRVFNNVECKFTRVNACAPIASEATVAALPVERQEVVPDGTVTADLESGEMMIVTFTAGENVRYKFTRDSPSLAVFTYGEASATFVEELDASGAASYEFDPGERVVLALFNRSTGAELLDLVITEDSVPAGFLSNGRYLQEITVDLSGGPRSLSLYFRPGTTVEVRAVPNSDQDITLEGSCYDCYSDVGYSGDPEQFSFYAGSDSQMTIVLDTWAGGSYYGTVTLYVFFFE